ncbi:MAG: 23S rRNA (pseudouridine(1915)-N(3))-methyltransferase RlmH [Bacteroidales bacterium]|jgi:23S rRNA (pseudouridine1915-N3)-methyltransferase|nr:23S rRNA (pseudouridine(1915)-N(3))-methyltransferase RlmH [Bacteroidales bacterium]
MKIKVIATGKTEEKYLKEGMDIYCKKLVHYFPFHCEELPAVKQTKSLTRHEQNKREGEIILKKITPTDILVLLDETGTPYSSVEFSVFLQQQMLQNNKQLVFAIGGPYGFSQEVYARKNYLVSLSNMTFSHQMVRLIFLEQLYRAASILKNEPYHHG